MRFTLRRCINCEKEIIMDNLSSFKVIHYQCDCLVDGESTWFGDSQSSSYTFFPSVY